MASASGEKVAVPGTEATPDFSRTFPTAATTPSLALKPAATAGMAAIYGAPSMAPAPVGAKVVPIDPETEVRALLERYRTAYERLDASAASRAWPSVNRQALARAFADLNSQSLKFDSCKIDVADTRGVASCRGRSTYVARVGSRTPYSREGEWTFALRKTGDEWQIDTVRSR